MSRQKGILLLLLFFTCSILLRLPNINRPLSKHHEYNTAVILVNIESWRQGGGGYRFHYVPLLNYQHPGDRFPQDIPQVDRYGNVVYVSFGPGWYLVPYFIYQVFHLPVEAVYLQIINLFFNLAAVIMLFFLCEELIPAGQARRYESILMTCLLFMFSPGVLWYLGNGYVTTGIEMPFVFALMLVLIPMLRSPEQIRFGRLMNLSLLIIILVYIDWFVLFVALVTGLWILFNIGKARRYVRLLVVISVASIAGVALPVLQFASYIGFKKLFLCLEHQFLFRSITSTGSTSFFELAAHVVQHIASSYLPVLLLLLGVFAGLRLRRIRIWFGKSDRIFLVIYGSAVFIYNLVFLQWSAVHEFALMPLSLVLAVLTARLTMLLVSTRGFYGVLLSFVLIAGIQYYLINRPGKVSWSGARYDSYQKLGERLTGIPEDHKIFMDSSWSAVIDHYAHRNINPVRNIDSARAFMQRWGVLKAVWVEQKNYELGRIVELPEYMGAGRP